MSHFQTRKQPERKTSRFTRRVESLPGKKFIPESAPCTFCPMQGIYRCEIPSCGIPLCEKHRIRKAGGDLCSRHKDAVLAQADAMPSDHFGDRGDAVPSE